MRGEIVRPLPGPGKPGTFSLFMYFNPASEKQPSWWDRPESLPKLPKFFSCGEIFISCQVPYLASVLEVARGKYNMALAEQAWLSSCCSNGSSLENIPFFATGMAGRPKAETMSIAKATILHFFFTSKGNTEIFI